MENKENVEQIDDFFSKLPEEDKELADVFDDKKPKESKPEEPKPDLDDPEKAPESVKDRRHRRLEKRLQEERESNIALNARVQALSEMDKFSKEVGDEVIPDIAKMFDSSDAGKENALRLSKVIAETQRKAKEDALKEIREESQKAVEEEREYESFIDGELESLEDEFGVDLTSNAPKSNKMRREFLEMVEELSPKDENGEIINYADFHAVFSQYSRITEKPQNTRREEIADRSMKRSTSGTESTNQRTRGFDGWKKDIERGII